MVIDMTVVSLIGIRVIKTAIAVILSIIIAIALGIPSPESVGLLAILGIQVTKKQGIRTVMARFGASIASLLLGAGLLLLIGFKVWVLPLFILIAFPILHRLKLGEGMITGTVIFFHLYYAHEVTTLVILNELLILLIGLGTATLINIVYMPPVDRQLHEQKDRLESLFSIIFQQFVRHLRDSETVWDGGELLEAHQIIEEGLALAQKKQENMLFSEAHFDWNFYFFMRSEQLEMVGRMTKLLAYIYQTLPQGHKLADIFEELSEDVRSDHYVGRTECDLNAFEQEFRAWALPETREEFEERSAMLQLIRELKAYLNIAKREKKQKESVRSF